MMRTQLVFAVALTVVPTAILPAATLTETDCQIDRIGASSGELISTQQSAGSFDCSLSAPGGATATASAFIGYSVAANQFDTAAQLSGISTASFVNDVFENSRARALASLDLRLFTTGPPRVGLLAFDVSIAGYTTGENTLDVFLGFGGIGFDTFAAFNFEACTGPSGVRQDNGACTGVVPFQLGRAFDVAVFGEYFSTGAVCCIYANGEAVASGSFRLFEANGSTPVEIRVAPEPATGLLLVGGLALLALRSANRRAP